MKRSSEHGTARNDVPHEFGDGGHFFALEGVLVFTAVLFASKGEFCDEVPSWNPQPLGVFLYFWCLQTHAFPDDEQDTPPDACFVDVADVAVARTLDAFGGFTVDHHRASANDLINFWGRRAVLEVATIEPKFFLYPFNLGVRGLVMADVKFSTNHVCNQHRKSLSGASCCPNWSCEVNRNKLGAVNVVEEAHFTDPFQWSHQDSLGQHG